MVVGHIRYSWLRSVGASSAQGWLGSEQLRLEVVDMTAGHDRPLRLDLTLSQSMDAVGVADEVVRRAALHWLTPGRETTPDDRAAFARLVSPPRLRPGRRTFASYLLPVFDGVAAPRPDDRSGSRSSCT